jgi:hypothetical protein
VRLKPLLVVLCASLLVSSCSTLRDVPLPPVVDATHLPDLHKGDHVVVTRKDGTTERFRVTVIEVAALAGKAVRVPYEEIASIEVYRVSAWRTAGAATAVVVTVAGALLYALIRADRHSD